MGSTAVTRATLFVRAGRKMMERWDEDESNRAECLLLTTEESRARVSTGAAENVGWWCRSNVVVRLRP